MLRHGAFVCTYILVVGFARDVLSTSLVLLTKTDDRVVFEYSGLNGVFMILGQVIFTIHVTY